MNVAIFCGSREGNNPKFKIIAYELGQELARRGHTILYGGGASGLMGAIAQGTVDMGGSVCAVLPEFLTSREIGNIIGVETEYVQTMDERKCKIYNPADAVIILPGGWGTMDELFEIMTLKMLDKFPKPIGILSIDGYYEPLYSFLHFMIEQWFVDIEEMDRVIKREDYGDLLESMGL